MRPTTEAIVARLTSSPEPMTAKQLGTTSKILRRTPGVEIAGEQRSGGRGRPALLFRVKR